MNTLLVRPASPLIHAFRQTRFGYARAALLSLRRLQSLTLALRGYWPGPMTALGLLATVPSCFSKLLLRTYTVSEMPPRRRLPPSLTVLFPYVEQRQG
jgi:hypothetical protein